MLSLEAIEMEPQTEHQGTGPDGGELAVPDQNETPLTESPTVNGTGPKPFARQYSLPSIVPATTTAIALAPASAEDESQNGKSKPAESKEKPKGVRLMALDAFRGLTVALMLMVNNAALGAATPETFVHARSGHDPTLADFVFPWFLLAVGIAIPFSAAGKREREQAWWQRFRGIFRRGASLYLVGSLIDSSIQRTPYWGLGVLQLIALAYLVGRLLYELPFYVRIALIGGCLWWYGWALTQLSVASYDPTGGFTEEHNLVKYLNENLFAPYRLQGIISVVPTAALVLLGSLVGDVIRRDKWLPVARFFLLMGLGANLTILGSVWGYFLPMNKPYWTPSYIIYAGGWGILVLGLLFLFADILGGRYWQLRLLIYPMVVYGTNALVAYAGAILVKVHILQEWHILVAGEKLTLQQAAISSLQAQFGISAGGWFYLIGYLGVVWCVCAYLYHQRLFVRA